MYLRWWCDASALSILTLGELELGPRDAEAWPHYTSSGVDELVRPNICLQLQGVLIYYEMQLLGALVLHRSTRVLSVLSTGRDNTGCECQRLALHRSKPRVIRVRLHGCGGVSRPLSDIILPPRTRGRPREKVSS